MTGVQSGQIIESNPRSSSLLDVASPCSHSKNAALSLKEERLVAEIVDCLDTIDIFVVPNELKHAMTDQVLTAVVEKLEVRGVLAATFVHGRLHIRSKIPQELVTDIMVAQQECTAEDTIEIHVLARH